MEHFKVPFALSINEQTTDLFAGVRQAKEQKQRQLSNNVSVHAKKAC